MDLECTTIDPRPPHPHTHTAIFLHGRGDEAANFARSLRFSRTRRNLALSDHLPTFRWVFPSSEFRPAVSNGGGKLWSQWFDIHNFWDFSEREQEVAGVGLRESVASVLKIVDHEVELLGGRRDKVVLMGISQGGAVGMHVLLNLSSSSLSEPKSEEKEEEGSVKVENREGEESEVRDRKQSASEHEQGVSSAVLPGTTTGRLGAFVGFSTWLPYVGKSLSEMREVLNLENAHAQPDNAVVKNTPVLLEHCANDQTVKLHHGVGARDAFQSFGAHVEWQEYWEGGHWFKAPEGIEDAVAFIRKNVPEVPEGE